MIAIHHRSGSFSDSWMTYLKNANIRHQIVNCFDSDILKKLSGCHGLMWHWSHYDYQASLFAKHFTKILEDAGMKVFPNYKTCWHFDDKVGQKYLLESINAPLVPTYIFYDKISAISWAKNTVYPKVFKLRCGAGAENVQLVSNEKSALKLIQKAFSSGFAVKSRKYFLKERLWHFKRDMTIAAFLNISKGFARLVIPTQAEQNFPREMGYAYFQDFIPGNDSDIRVVVIGKRAFAIKRMVRDGDFRASGSGQIIYEPDGIPKLCLEIAFELARRLKTQCLAFDFVIDNKQPRVVEISYAFSSKAYLKCPGYWTEDLDWIGGHFKPEELMAEDFLMECNISQ